MPHGHVRFPAAGLAAVHAYERGGRTDHQHRAVRRAWDAFDRLRLEKLVGCN